jgi:hypothetical protein
MGLPQTHPIIDIHRRNVNTHIMIYADSGFRV